MQDCRVQQINDCAPTAIKRNPPWRIALTANIKNTIANPNDSPPDAGAEFDQLETVEAIAAALEADGHWVTICNADHTLPEALVNLKPHFVFNIAEGIGGDAHEAQVPALCEILGVPYTVSRVLTNAISLDKTQTKRIWQSFGLPTPSFQEFHTGQEPIEPNLRYPLFVKPAREGTGMGMGQKSVVYNEEELRQRVSWLIETYKQPALAEEFLTGREYTVGFIGNPGFPGMRYWPTLYDFDGYHFFPVLEIDTERNVTPGVYGYKAKSINLEKAGAPGYLCPAEIPDSLRDQLFALARRAAEAIGVCDVARVDFRLDADGNPFMLEINTFPGLNPELSDICIMAQAEGFSFYSLITEILYLAAERFHMPTPSVSTSSLLPMAALRQLDLA